MTSPAFFSRREGFARVGSTNDVVAGWLGAGEPEVCVATAEEQTNGRGREGRTWLAPAGTGLLLSLGFRPTWLSADHVWQLPAIASLSMAEAAEETAGLGPGTIALKWPNDLVVERPPRERHAPALEGRPDGHQLLKLGGVLGETVGLGTADPRVVVGIGLNTDWRRDEFPTELADSMTSLREVSGRSADWSAVLGAFLVRLERRVVGLRAKGFPGPDWQSRQVTTGRLVDLLAADGSRRTVRAVGVDADSGGLVIGDPSAPHGTRVVFSGEILHLRFAPATQAAEALSVGAGV